MSTQTDAKKGGSDSNVSEVEARKLVPESSATSDPADNTSEDGSEDLGLAMQTLANLAKGAYSTLVRICEF